jgi:UDP-N-acetylmuramoyl-L-alanyl-D-glutamate--2,6-diaminopimelate ligase
MTKMLKELARIDGDVPPHLTDIPIGAVTADSRCCTPGSLFVALKGEQVDGHDFIHQAKNNGAVGIVGNQKNTQSIADLPYFYSSKPGYWIGKSAHILAGNPTHDMCVIGVTGTNGKSSTVCLLQAILNACGHSCASLGTLGYDVGVTLEANHTTPPAEDLARLFQQANDAGKTHAVMEVSSHALAQERVAGIHFTAALFTNLTQDHLDFHGSMEEYMEEKLRLFRYVTDPSGVTVANADDPAAPMFKEASAVNHYTFGTHGDCQLDTVKTSPIETVFSITSPWGAQKFKTHLLGHHNLANVLGAITMAGGLGCSLKQIESGIDSIKAVPGRFEKIDCGQDFFVVVDYAHTDDGLKNVLEASRTITDKKVFVLFGCGGDRDKLKRPKMGQVAAELADFAILTSDNPRTESPERILMDAEVGLQRAGKKRDQDYEVIEDRKTAIERVIDLAGPGDLVMISGKGHEDYQILNTGKIHFDDREVARNYLESVQ